jgi:hypothetical protein
MSWNLQCDTVVPLNEKRGMVTQVIKSVCPKREKTMGGTIQNGILKGDQRL